MDAVARLHIAALGVAGDGILQHLGTVQELPALLLAHFDERFVVLVHLGLGQALVGVLLPDGRDGVDDDVHAGVGGDDGLDAGLVVFDEVRGLIAGVQVVRAEGQDDPARLQFRHGLGHCDVAGRSAYLHAGKGRQALGGHAHRADGVVVAAIVEHAVHAGRVAVAQKQRLVHIAVARVGALLKDRGGVGLGIDGVFLFIIAALDDHGRAVHGGHALGVRAAEVDAADEHQRDADADQQHDAAQSQHQIHLAAHIQRFFLL